MSRLKSVSTIRASLPRMASTESTNGEKKFFIHGSAYSFIFLLLHPMSQEIIHWLLPVSVCVQVSKYDDDYGVSLDLP